MKRFYSFILALLIFCLCTITVCAAGTVYTDPETGVAFTLPVGWYENEDNNETLRTFVTDENPTLNIIYSCTDAWENTPIEIRFGLQREDLNNSILSLNMFSEIFDEEFDLYGGADEYDVATYNDLSYYQVKITTTKFVDGAPFTFHIMQLYLIDAGYIHLFQLTCVDNSSIPPEFISVMNSVAFPQKLTGNQIYKLSPERFLFAEKILPNAIWFVIGLVLTIIIYAIPVLIYRHCIRRKPMANQSAKVFVVVYSCIVLLFGIVFCPNFYKTTLRIAFVIAVLSWSRANYDILTHGNWVLNIKTYTPGSADDEYPNSNVSQAPVLFCRKCGTKLEENSGFCHNCGCKIAQPEKENSTKNQFEGLGFGLTPLDPICTRGSIETSKYLYALRTTTGERLTWRKKSAPENIKKLNALVDVCEGVLPCGEVYKTVYINQFSHKNSKKIPEGFMK